MHPRCGSSGGYVELYRAGGLEDPERLADAMRRTEAETVRMGGLVEDLLSLARLDEGRPLEVVDVDLCSVVEDAAADARAVDPTRAVETSTATPVVVRADEARIRQVVANLVGNALVHTPDGTPVRLSCGTSDGSSFLEVSDDGPGMAPEVAERAFERFYRADPSRSRHRGGSGLGLAIVDAAVGAHNGRVSLVSVPGEGTTIRVDLPTRPN
ncbi:MAG: HAMP domain-containing sensor histidine kinase [Microthrixaceae bacterium]